MLMHTRITHRCKMKCMRLTHTLRCTSARRECLCTFSPLCTAGCSCCRTPLLLVRALVRRANFPHPEHRNYPLLTFALKCTNVHEYIWTTRTFGGVIFNWLFECCDVTKRTQEEHHLLLFISYRCYFHKKPNPAFLEKHNHTQVIFLLKKKLSCLCFTHLCIFIHILA